VLDSLSVSAIKKFTLKQIATVLITVWEAGEKDTPEQSKAQG